MLNAATEVDDALPFMKSTVQQAFANWAKEMTKIMEAGIKKNEFRKDIDTKAYASTFLMLIEGGILLSKVVNGPDHLNLALDRIVKIVNEEIVK